MGLRRKSTASLSRLADARFSVRASMNSTRSCIVNDLSTSGLVGVRQDVWWVEPLAHKRTLREAAARYPADFRQGQLADVERIAFHVNLVRRHVPPGGHLADIGGGLSMFALVCALEGMATTLVDDFRDPYPGHSPDSDVLDSTGVRVYVSWHVTSPRVRGSSEAVVTP